MYTLLNLAAKTLNLRYNVSKLFTCQVCFKCLINDKVCSFVYKSWLLPLMSKL